MSALIWLAFTVVNAHWVILAGNYTGRLEWYIEQINDPRVSKYLRNLYLLAVWGITLFFQGVVAILIYFVEKGI
jgi:hypothetical protein